MVSGVLPAAAADARPRGRCEVTPRAGLVGGDLQLDASLPGLVVPVGTAQACCEWRQSQGQLQLSGNCSRRLPRSHAHGLGLA